MEITKETIDLYKKRVANCITPNGEKDTWAYNFGCKPTKITKKLKE